MTLKTKKIISFCVLSLALLTVALPTFAQYGLKETGEAAGIIQKGGEPKSIASIIGTIINVLLSLLGIGFFGLMIYAGILYLTSQGESKQTETARSLIKSAVIGLIIVLSAYAITNFVMSRIVKPITSPAVPGSDIYQTL